MGLVHYGIPYDDFRKGMQNNPGFRAYQEELDTLVCARFAPEKLKAFYRAHSTLFSPAIIERVQNANEEKLRMTYDRLKEQRKKDYEADGRLAEFIRKCEESGSSDTPQKS